MSAAPRRWWHDQVVYQIYPRSFCDSNGDGIGDLPGIVSRLDHLSALGVGVVWLSPVYCSPQVDNGYDISDHCNIAPEFGTLADFAALVAALHGRGIRLVMDLVLNHTSDQHPWFAQARRSRRDPLHDFYTWAEPGADGAPPNNWEAAFSGPAWTWNEATGEYYLHLFSPQQPELNWRSARLRAELHNILRCWLARGVDGFRLDVINLIAKPWTADGRLADAPVLQPGPLQPAFAQVVHGAALMGYLRALKAEVLAGHDLLTVGEAPLATPAQGRALTHPDSGALDMLFQFEHMDLDSQPGAGKWACKPLHLPDLKASMQRWQDALHGVGWNSLYLSNHDQPRPVSRWGDDGRWRVHSAKMLATWLHGLQGTPFVYQGEELGMTNAPLASIGDCRDLESINHYHAAVQRGQHPAQVMAAIRAKGRDNARTPMPWHGGRPDGGQDGADDAATGGANGAAQAGFTTGTPWLSLNPNFTEINAESARADADSVFHHYRQLIALRRQHPVWLHGRTVPLLAAHAQIAAYLRVWQDERLLVLCNFSAQPQHFELPAEAALTAATLLLGNWPEHEPTGPAADQPGPAPSRLPAAFVLRPFEARLYLGRA